MGWRSWGYNDVGETAHGYLNDGTEACGFIDVPPAVPTTPAFIEGYGSGWTTGTAFDDQGYVWVWGEISGTLGTSFIGDDWTAAQDPAGSNAAATAFRLTYADAVNVIAVGTTDRGLAWLRSDGRMFAVGNCRGDFGIGEGNVHHGTPVEITPAGTSIVDAVFNDWGSHFALDTLGRVWMTGRNDHGQRGNGTWSGSVQVTTWAQVPGLGTITKIRSSGLSCWAWDNTGQCYAWGGVGAGNGVGGPTSGLTHANLITSPTAVPDLAAGVPAGDVVGLACGNQGFPEGYALMMGAAFFVPGLPGDLYATGFNLYGNLGLGDTVHRGAPVHNPLPSGVLVKRLPVVGGECNSFGCAGSDDNYWACGANLSGMVLGICDETEQHSFVQAVAFPGVVDKVYLMGDNSVFIGVTEPSAPPAVRRVFAYWA